MSLPRAGIRFAAVAAAALLLFSGCQHRRAEPLHLSIGGDNTIPEGWPAAANSFRVNDEFGPRAPGPGSSFHKGIDFCMPEGTPVRATADGTVAFSGAQRGYGQIVVLHHSPEYDTAYAHLRKRYVQQGDLVGKGESIGESGQTGNATGPHLHYEVRKNGEPVNPRPYLPLR